MRKPIIWLFFIMAHTVNTVNANIISTIGLQCGANKSYQVFTYDGRDIPINNQDLSFINGGIIAELFENKYYCFVANLTVNVFDSYYWNLSDSFKSIVSPNTVYSWNSSIDNELFYLSFSPQLKLKYKIYSVEPYLLIGFSIDKIWKSESGFSEQIKDKMHTTDFTGSFGFGTSYEFTKKFKVFYNMIRLPSFFNMYKDNKMVLRNDVLKVICGIVYIL